MKIKIYAEDYDRAAQFAAKMNLGVRHWEYAGHGKWVGLEWADVGSVMDHYMFGGLPE